MSLLHLDRLPDLNGCDLPLKVYEQAEIQQGDKRRMVYVAGREGGPLLDNILYAYTANRTPQGALQIPEGAEDFFIEDIANLRDYVPIRFAE